MAEEPIPTPIPVEMAAEVGDGAKRRQILDGARQVFLERGFDAASMNDVTRAAGVSKGTVYAYFPSKEALFKALITADKQEQVERVCILERSVPDLREALITQGELLLTGLTAPDSIARVRMVVGVAPRQPEIGRAFFEAGYGVGVTRLAAFLRQRAAQGQLTLDDPVHSAKALINLCYGDLLRQVLFCVIDAPTAEMVRDHVAAGVDLFLKAHPPAADRRMDAN